jgi:hypothetical protein
MISLARFARGVYVLGLSLSLSLLLWPSISNGQMRGGIRSMRGAMPSPQIHLPLNNALSDSTGAAMRMMGMMGGMRGGMMGGMRGGMMGGMRGGMMGGMRGGMMGGMRGGMMGGMGGMMMGGMGMRGMGMGMGGFAGKGMGGFNGKKAL